MSDLGDDFKALRKHSQERRALKREEAPQLLADAKLTFISSNEGAHLIVVGPTGAIFDFWPGTGRWASRALPTKSGRGVSQLIKHLQGASHG